MFFPEGCNGLHDSNRVLPISESDFVMHYMRNVRKELLYSPYFISTAVYRLETNRLVSAFYALRGYITSDSDDVERLPDDRLRFMKLVGSADYYEKQYLEIKAKSVSLGYPEIFYTFTNTDRWETTLASCLLQEGYNVWHVQDEQEELTLLPDKKCLDQHLNEEYVVHTPEAGSSTCPFHVDCQRVYVSAFLDPVEQTRILTRNLYTVNRVFDQRVRSLVRQVLSSPVNPMQVKAFHDVKEFGDVSGWAHLHGVAWRKNNITKRIFQKLHAGEAVSEAEKKELAVVAESVVCVRLDPTRIAQAFPDLDGERSRTIAKLATKYQCHGCTEKCLREEKAGCWYGFPREPCGLTLIAAPPPQTMAKDVKSQLIKQAFAVKKAVKKLVKRMDAIELQATSLQQLIVHALGEVTITTEGTGFQWTGGVFPKVEEASPHSVLRWYKKLSEVYGQEVLNALSVYYAALSTSCTDDHHLVSRRAVAEVWVADYNPYCLEAMQSNMEVKLVLATPNTVLRYVTKGGKTGHNTSRVVNALLDQEFSIYATRLGNRAQDMNEICESEAFFRLDKQLHMSDTNVTTVWVNSGFPNERTSSFVRADAGGVALPARPGEYLRKDRIEDRYEKKCVL